jgi:PAS domain S-box-containing protein
MVRSFLIRFLLIATILVVILFLAYRTEAGSLKDIIEADSSNSVGHQELGISNTFRQVASDLMILSSQRRLREMLESDRSDLREALAADYLVYSTSKGIYDQIRFLDEMGMEVIRVNFNDGRPAVVPADQLQPKGNRYYFDDTFSLGEGDIFISPFDLNVEHGEIEQPLKPMIRFGTPVFDNSGQKRGILLLNYLGAEMLEDLEGQPDRYSQLMLQNSGGYWLKGPTPEDEWGFMYESRGHLTFGSRFPEAWQVIREARSGQLENDDGLFTFQAIFPSVEVQRSSSGTKRGSEPSAQEIQPEGYSWTVVSHVTPEALRAEMRPIRTRFILLFAGLAALLAGGSFAVILVERNRKQAQMALQASSDENAAVDEVARVITSSLDIEQVYKKFAAEVKKLVGFDRMVISVIDRDAGVFIRQHVSGVRYEEQEIRTTVPLEGRISEQVQRTGRSQFRDGTEGGDSFAGDDIRLEAGLLSSLAVPLFSQGRIMGALTVHSKQARAYAPKNQAVLERLAGQIAPAVENAQIHRELGERVKELDCLYGISTTAEEQDISLEELLQRACEFLPPGWQYPEITCSRIITDGREFKTENFKETVWKQAAEIVARGDRRGSVEVYYLEERPAGYEGPFLKEERKLIDAVAQQLGQTIERRQVSDALRESEARYKDLYEEAPIAYFSVDAGGCILRANRQAEELFGYTEGELIGQPAHDLYADTAAGKRRAREVFGQFLAGGSVRSAELQFRRVDGQRLWGSLSVDPALDASGEIQESRWMVADITDRKLAEEEREVLIAELEVKNEELERFTYTVSHDLKSPLVTVKNFLGLLAQDTAEGNPGGVRADMARISDAAEQMRTLLDDLLELSRVGRVIGPREAVPLGEVARDALAFFAGQAAERDVQVTVASGLPVVQADRQRIREVYLNLLDNAIKFTREEPDPRVEIGFRQEKGENVYLVRDNGMGIDPRYHLKVFELFDQLDQRVEGTGVGLTLVKRIVEVHGGRIWVESDGLGRGSTFCFTLPPEVGAPDDEEAPNAW